MTQPIHKTYKPLISHFKFRTRCFVAPQALLLFALMPALFSAGCIAESGAEGTFDRTFTVQGPVQLEVSTGSGDVQITPATGNEVRIHGEIHAHGWSSDDARAKLRDIAANPPISQENNLIRVGGNQRLRNFSIDYRIEVPAATELHCGTGSGDVQVRGIQGPATFTSGSGNIHASEIGNDVQATAGSGDVAFSDVQGQVQVGTGSGDISVHTAKGAVRLHTGSGKLEIAAPNDAVVAETGSGDVIVNGAHADLRVHTGSGNVQIDGNPAESSYWDLHASSGDVTLHVPGDASFRLYARTGSGDIDAGIPIVLEGTSAKHELRARIGDGKGRVEVETSSGKINLH
jgi:DUF4097 and DUF4098 domain-containing protein YvlB